jgi:hypothetical protein
MKETPKPADPLVYYGLSILLAVTSLGICNYEMGRLFAGKNLDWLTIPMLATVVGAGFAYRDGNNISKIHHS